MSNIFNFESVMDVDTNARSSDTFFGNSMANERYEDWPSLRSMPEPETLPKIDKQRYCIYFDIDEIWELRETCKVLKSKLRKLLRKINRPTDLTLETIDLTNE